MDDLQLWRSCRDGVEIRASVTTLHAAQDSGPLYNAELRITKNDEPILRKIFCDERKLHARSMQLFERIRGGTFKPALSKVFQAVIRL